MGGMVKNYKSESGYYSGTVKKYHMHLTQPSDFWFWYVTAQTTSRLSRVKDHALCILAMAAATAKVRRRCSFINMIRIPSRKPSSTLKFLPSQMYAKRLRRIARFSQPTSARSQQAKKCLCDELRQRQCACTLSVITICLSLASDCHQIR